MKRHFRSVALLAAGLAILHAMAAPAASHAETILLVVEAARDTTAGFRAHALPELERRALTWPDGVITLPDTAAWRRPSRSEVER